MVATLPSPRPCHLLSCEPEGYENEHRPRKGDARVDVEPFLRDTNVGLAAVEEEFVEPWIVEVSVCEIAAW